jgi:hypothetical protein
MKRDMNLIRSILLEIERVADDRRYFSLRDSELAPDDVLFYHLSLLKEAGLINATLTGQRLAAVHGLTWNGHEFLDNIRNDKVWADVTQRVAGHGGSAAFSVIVELAKKAALGYFGLT